MWQRPRKKVSRGLFLQSLIPLQSFHLLVLILDIERRGQKDTYLAEIDEFFTISRASDPFTLHPSPFTLRKLSSFPCSDTYIARRWQNAPPRPKTFPLCTPPT